MLTRVVDVMLRDDLPLLGPNATMRDAVVHLAERRGIAVVAEQGKLVGVVTTGDFTRLVERAKEFLDVPVSQVMTQNPKSAGADELGSAVVFRMQQHGIMSMPVVDSAQSVVGVVHLHDLMRSGAA